jgi:hypothetical protein
MTVNWTLELGASQLPARAGRQPGNTVVGSWAWALNPDGIGESRPRRMARARGRARAWRPWRPRVVGTGRVGERCSSVAWAELGVGCLLGRGLVSGERAHEALRLCLVREQRRRPAIVFDLRSSASPAPARGWARGARPQVPRATVLARPSGLGLLGWSAT